MTSHDYTPLDPAEGPTVWAKQHEDNPHSYDIVEGTDPKDPLNEYSLSVGEIDRLAALAEDPQ